MENARSYTYLFALNHEDKPRNQILELNETLTQNTLIIKCDYTHKYYIFDSHSKYLNNRPSTNFLHHEVISGWRPQKPKFDIDGGDSTNTEEIIEYIVTAFFDLYDKTPDFIVCDSSNK